MSHFDFELVIKIGSMALIREEDNDLNYNIISRLPASGAYTDKLGSGRDRQNRLHEAQRI